MINFEEHKKLLAQITELEKNSVNYFDVEKEFFLISSDNLADVKTRLYGYSIQATGIYEEDNLTEDAVKNLDGRGCYVYVEVKDGQITIKQDLNGCWGIYLFRHGDYFALSNSFFRLLDHIKFKYPLTVNRDYCHYLFTRLVAIQSDFQTAVNEVRIIERNAALHINMKTRTLEIEPIDYKEHSVTLDSEKGVAILDRWVDFWGNLLSNLAQHTNFIQADLTGGFDTRISWVPLLHSGIDLNKIRVHSIEGNFRIYAEDHAIASQIGDHYGFKLNKPFPVHSSLNLSLVDAWNLDFYTQQTFRNAPVLFYNQKKSVDKLYCLTGLAGEVLRETWHMPPQKFIEQECSIGNRYSRILSQDLSHSIQNIIKSVFRNVCDKYKIEDPNSVDIPQYLYHETRTRTHCGKTAVSNYFKNSVTIIPFYDPEVQTLQLKSSKCPDYNLLMVLLFTRYAPDLLKIRFDKFHKPPDLENLIPYAQKINERFPRRLVTNDDKRGGFHLQPRDLQAEEFLATDKNNPNIPSGLAQNCLKSVFESSRTYGLFTTYFDEEIYNYVANFYDNNTYARFSPLYSVVGVSRVLEDVEISQRNHPLYQDIKRFLEKDFALVHDDARVYAQIIDKFSRYITATIMVRLYQNTNPKALEILSVSDSKAKISKVEYHQKDGVCYSIKSYTGSLEIVAKALEDGQARIYLSAPFVTEKDNPSKHIPYYIDYTEFIVNDKVVFDEIKPIWHDKSFRYIVDNVKAGEEIKIQVEWLPHRSDT